MKICSKCNIEKNLTDFHKKSTGKFGVGKICKPCYSIDRHQRYEQTRKKQLAKNEEWKLNNQEKYKQYHQEYYLKTKFVHDKRTREWFRNHPEYGRHRQNIRRSLLLKRLPKWANVEKIKEIYKEALLLKQKTNQDFHVDHIVPLRGKNVSGLHVEYNLQIISAKENMNKGNHFA